MGIALPRGKNGEKPVLLIRPRLLLPSVLYVLIVQDGYFYFCRLGNKPTATAAQEHRYRTGMPEKELLGARGSFKIAAGDVEQILRQTARDPWTAGTGNGGTVWLRIDGREHRYILANQTPPELLAERLRAGGYARYAVEDNAAPEDDGPAPTRADTRMVRRLGKILGGLTAVGAVWALFLPGSLTGAAALNMLLPPTAMVVWWKYRRALHGPRVNTTAASGFAAAAMLPPLILTIRVMSAVHARHIAPMLLGLLALTAAATAVGLWRFRRLRSKAAAFGVLLFLFTYLYSGILSTNGMVCTKEIARYHAVIEREYSRHGYRSVSHYLVLSAWDGQADGNTLAVDWQTYLAASAGGTLTISRQRGLWGIEWDRLEPDK